MPSVTRARTSIHYDRLKAASEVHSTTFFVAPFARVIDNRAFLRLTPDEVVVASRLSADVSHLLSPRRRRINRWRIDGNSEIPYGGIARSSCSSCFFLPLCFVLSVNLPRNTALWVTRYRVATVSLQLVVNHGRQSDFDGVSLLLSLCPSYTRHSREK